MTDHVTNVLTDHVTNVLTDHTTNVSNHHDRGDWKVEIAEKKTSTHQPWHATRPLHCRLFSVSGNVFFKAPVTQQ